MAGVVSLADVVGVFQLGGGVALALANCNSLKPSLWDSDARTQRQHGSLQSGGEEDRPVMCGVPLGWKCPHRVSGVTHNDLSSTIA